MEKKRALINIFINRIYLYDDHYTLILNGGNHGVELENIPLEVLDSSAFKGISEQIRCSSLVADAPPIRKTILMDGFSYCLTSESSPFQGRRSFVSFLMDAGPHSPTDSFDRLSLLSCYRLWLIHK